MATQHIIGVTRREALTLGAGALGTLAACYPVCAAEQAGSVVELVGTATASIEGKTRRLAIQEAVLVGDVVETQEEARLALLLGRRTKLQLGGATSVRIDQYIADAGGEIEFTQGTIGVNRSGRPSAHNLQFKTPYGLIAVRGTAFIAGPSRGVFGVCVRRGTVEVSSAGKSVVLNLPRQGTDIAAPGAAPAEPKIWKKERVLELYAKLRV